MKPNPSPSPAKPGELLPIVDYVTEQGRDADGFMHYGAHRPFPTYPKFAVVKTEDAQAINARTPAQPPSDTVLVKTMTTTPENTKPGELKPCPFCGGEGHLVSRKKKSTIDGVLDTESDRLMGSAKETHERHIVVCMDSDCRGWHPQQVKQLYRSASVAVERWNTRTPSHPVPADSVVVKRADAEQVASYVEMCYGEAGLTDDPRYRAAMNIKQLLAKEGDG
jgi:hypothetical protein